MHNRVEQVKENHHQRPQRLQLAVSRQPQSKLENVYTEVGQLPNVSALNMYSQWQHVTSSYSRI